MDRRAAQVAVALALAVPATASAAGAPPTVGPGGCIDLTPANADYEAAYGPTDVNVQAGNGRVTVNENDDGTITVFKYPNPSLNNLVKYFAVKRDLKTGVVQAQAPNEGSFAGLRYTTAADKRAFVWLRDLPSRQRYDSPDTPVPITTYRGPGFKVVDTDITPPGTDRFVRRYRVTGRLRRASLVYFENFNPTANHVPLLPIADWCLASQSDQHAEWDAGQQAIVNGWAGTDEATGKPASIAAAFGFAGRASKHQVGGDAYEPTSTTTAHDAYDSAPAGLDGTSTADGQTTGAVEQRLRFRHRRATAQLTIAGGTDGAAAVKALNAGRAVPFARQLAAVRRDWHRWLKPRTLPKTGDKRITLIAKRALINLRLARAAETGALVASVNTQGPYGEDWIRDGAFLNHMLDENGLHDWVTQHNRFYARVQTSESNPSTLRPIGNWPMNSYADGVDGAPIPWEIDETGLGAWTLWEHVGYLDGAAATAYLADVYPAIGRAADYLTACEDVTNGLQCQASEDDNYTPSQGLHGAETVLLGLRSAVAAARRMGDTSVRPTLWAARADRLTTAIEHLYDPKTKAYSVGDASGNGYIADYGDGGWLLWPTQFKPYDDATMVAEADHVLASTQHSFSQPYGQYESKALLGLAYAWAPLTTAHKQILDGMLHHVAADLTTPTGLIGESWQRIEGGRIIPVQDMPHVWEQALFYMSAVQTDGARPYRFAHR